MSGTKKVALIGWDPDVVDYDKWPDLTPEKLMASLEADRGKLNELGYEATLLFIEDADTAYDAVSQADGLRDPRCAQCFQEVRVAFGRFHQSMPRLRFVR